VQEWLIKLQQGFLFSFKLQLHAKSLLALMEMNSVIKKLCMQLSRRLKQHIIILL